MSDRQLPTDVVVIADLRVSNLFCSKEDYAGAHRSDISEIAARGVAVKRRWSYLEAVRSRRDIDAAISRHPNSS